MPGVYKTAWDIGSSCHEETGKVSNPFAVQRIDRGKDDHASKGNGQCKDDVVCSLTEIVGRLCDT